jgi:Mg-chelatase subunit ChlD
VREGALLPDPGAPGIRAGEWDDNANYREFQKYLASARSPFSIDVSRRVFLVVRDAQGRAVPQCDVTVTGANDGARHTRTGASGRALFFPASSQVTAAQATLVATAHCRGAVASAQFAVNGQDQAVDLRLPVQSTQNLNDQPIIDIAFVLDTTGSMSEEIASVKRTIAKVTRELPQLGMRVRIGLVEFKDRGDQFVTRGYPLTENLAAFSTNIAQVSAGGGGDTPEAVEEGMAHAVYQLNWSENAASRVAFLIGDAPPHAERLGNMSELLKETQRRGITFHTVAASGMDDTGQAFWRRVAQYTGGTNMFVLRGGAGPQSTGAGDPISSCGGTHKNYSSGNLDELILGKIQRERDYLRADPMAIPGLATDENARPCPKRTQLTPLVAAR